MCALRGQKPRLHISLRPPCAVSLTRAHCRAPPSATKNHRDQSSRTLRLILSWLTPAAPPEIPGQRCPRVCAPRYSVECFSKGTDSSRAAASSRNQQRAPVRGCTMVAGSELSLSSRMRCVRDPGPASDPSARPRSEDWDLFVCRDRHPRVLKLRGTGLFVVLLGGGRASCSPGRP